jgi:hypothetical protein
METINCLESKSKKYILGFTVRVREVGGSNPLTPTESFYTALPEEAIAVALRL